MKLRYYIILCFLLIGLSTILAQSNDLKIKDYRYISNLMQEGIESALNNEVIQGIGSFDKAFNHAFSKGYFELLPIITISQGRLYALESKHDLCLEKLQKVQQYILLDSISSMSGDYYELKAQSYLALDQYDLALIALQKTEVIRKVIEPAKNWRTYNGMARIYHKLNQHDLADKYSGKAEKLSKIQNSRRILMDLQNDLRFDEKDGTIAALNSENKSVIKNLQQSKTRNRILGVGLGILGIVSALLYIILRQRTRLNNEMKLRNDLINKSLEEKEFLIKEIHHRVKNNLQVISSLLSLQSRTVEDQQTIDVLNESQSRVQSMSVIHQSLYKDGPSSLLNIKEYITNLVQNLFDTYNINKAKIKLVLDIDDLTFDVASLVPIGLIINELITNSLKYAYQGRDHGILGLSCHKKDGFVSLIVWDDGVGNNSTLKSGGFGSKLILAFVKRLSAEIKYDNNNGTRTEMLIPDQALTS